ncbi:MAG: hypothetical protein ABGX20_21490 [Bacillus sp. (in: firmicutes)]
MNVYPPIGVTYPLVGGAYPPIGTRHPLVGIVYPPMNSPNDNLI